ncbi:hypothetical protein WN51_01588 [Melipona quadrifasciata]|uniref:Uncharacterized protein n=1 Tax=Melipona quadrifasciata TaxID=166423 RepID=A0A0M8ZUC5_9HYME|nr:hypothetical protein WN51_01588 [Melipona quadrifasciata]
MANYATRLLRILTFCTFVQPLFSSHGWLNCWCDVKEKSGALIIADAELSKGLPHSRDFSKLALSSSVMGQGACTVVDGSRRWRVIPIAGVKERETTTKLITFVKRVRRDKLQSYCFAFQLASERIVTENSRAIDTTGEWTVPSGIGFLVIRRFALNDSYRFEVLFHVQWRRLREVESSRNIMVVPKVLNCTVVQKHHQRSRGTDSGSITRLPSDVITQPEIN